MHTHDKSILWKHAGSIKKAGQEGNEGPIYLEDMEKERSTGVNRGLRNHNIFP